MLDSASSEDDLETSRNELHSALQHPQLCTLPFLILANHQDKPAARSVQEVRSLHARLSVLLVVRLLLRRTSWAVVKGELMLLGFHTNLSFISTEPAFSDRNDYVPN